MSDEEEIRKQFLDLTATYKAKLPGLLRELRQQLKSYFENPPDPALLEAVYLQVHKLSGTGATFGLNSVSTYSKKIENLLSLIKQGNVQADGHQFEQILAWLEKMANI